MKITNAGRGIHKRETKGVGRFKTALPDEWYAFTNLDLVLSVGRAREIDMVIVSDRRIFFIDLKDWHGKIQSSEGRWLLNGVDKDASPVAKITSTVRDVLPLLKEEFRKRPETQSSALPRIEGLVVLTGSADRTGIAETERAKVLNADEFLNIVQDNRRDRESFGNVAEEFLVRPLTGDFWRDKINRFFNAGPTSPFRPGKRRFERFTADETPTFVHSRGLYQEYNAADEADKNNLGTLRLWDFTKCSDIRFQNEEGRHEIAGREQLVYHWLRDRSREAEQILLPPKIDDPYRGVHYWEIYDRRRRMERLAVFAQVESARLAPPEKIELARQILASTAALHRQDAAHLDLGGHSIWLETPTTAKFSHLMAARFPEGRSLGEARYQFLASVDVPEDHLDIDGGPKCRDVFLVGVAVHQLLFGTVPQGSPPEWSAEIDSADTFRGLHDWFAEALELDPFRRFRDALQALEEFNRATAQRPTPAEVISGLDRYRGSIRTARQLVKAFPEIGDLIIENDRVEMWRSERDGIPVVVKRWKQAFWGDTIREGSAILAFLDKAAGMKADRPAGIPSVREVLWLGDSMAIVRDWIQGETLEEVLTAPPEDFRTPVGALTFVQRLARTVHALHDGGQGHGDLTPANIVLSAEAGPVLIDVLDFSPRADGERLTPAYAPPLGGIFERDRYAITRIAEEVFACTLLSERDRMEIASAIADCREKEPRLSTVLPLLDQVEAALARLRAPLSDNKDDAEVNYEISVLGAATGPIEPDEGYLFLRLRHDTRGVRFLVLRGATEELHLRLGDSGEPISGRRQKLQQRQIRRVAAHEFHMVAATLTVSDASLNDFSALLPVLALPDVQARMKGAQTGLALPQVEPEDSATTSIAEDAEDVAEDALAEEIAALPAAAPEHIDVPALWRELIDVENELTIEGIAQVESVFDRRSNRHRVAIELESGAFEFSRLDVVGVEKQDRRGVWRRIGQLDLQLSRSDLAVIDTSQTSAAHHTYLVDAGQRLRFWSHFERQSLKRRTEAVDRILAGNGRSRDLLSVFDPRAGAVPADVSHAPAVGSLEKYGLNRDQEAAFERIIVSRPVGLVQGPPGTGKTRFIASLAHFSLTNGLARNVLLASQSHEAVNTAAEAVLALFRRDGIRPSLLRIGRDEQQVSLPLRSYHTPKVEQEFKDRFRAEFRDRLAEIARALGLPESAADEMAAIETVIRPLAESLADLAQQTGMDQQRLNSLRDTLRQHLERLDLAALLDDEAELEWYTFADAVVHAVTQRYARGPGADRYDRLNRAAAIGRDFIGSVSRSQRSFETFLAGTRQIVAGTCVGLGRTSLGLTATAFDLVIIDEAARCTASELLVPLQAARWAVLVGDHLQLEPQHKAEVVNVVAERTGLPKSEIKRSDFERVFTTPYGRASGVRLSTQYRMLAPIGELVSEAFYQDAPLVAGRAVPEIDPLQLPAALDVPLLWVETDGMGAAAHEQKEKHSKSRTNRAEADVIVAMLENWYSHERFRTWLTNQQKHPAGIGVICMYAAQRDLVARKLRQSALAHHFDRHVKVGTVDSYQGKENPIVILSLVRNNEDGPLEAGVRRVREGFLVAPNRINVAVSRAMDRLVVVGLRGRWSANRPMGRIVKAFNRQVSRGTARVIGADETVKRGAQSHTRNTSMSPREAAPEGGGNG